MQVKGQTIGNEFRLNILASPLDCRKCMLAELAGLSASRWRRIQQTARERGGPGALHFHQVAGSVEQGLRLELLPEDYGWAGWQTRTSTSQRKNPRT